MAFIKKNNSHQIGDFVVTTKQHESMEGIFLKGSTVIITDIDPIRGYSIEDEDGNRMVEIGWEI